jgi:type IV pilus assembly protein PilO
VTLREIYEELQSLDLRNPGVWPGWAHIGAALLTAVVILGAGTYFLVAPKHEELNEARRKELSLRQEFERKQQKVAALDAYKAQLAEMQRSFGDMLKQLPSKSEVANLLNDISQTRIASGLEEELFQPLPEVPKEFYAEIPNKIVVTGNYHQMGQFVSGVAALPRIVTIEDVQIQPAGKGAGGELRMTAIAKTYRYLDESEIAASKPRAGAK